MSETIGGAQLDERQAQVAAQLTELGFSDEDDARAVDAVRDFSEITEGQADGASINRLNDRLADAGYSVVLYEEYQYLNPGSRLVRPMAGRLVRPRFDEVDGTIRVDIESSTQNMPPSLSVLNCDLNKIEQNHRRLQVQGQT